MNFILNLLYLNILIYLIYCFHRFEPYKLYNERKLFYLSNFNKFSEYLQIQFDYKINKFKCIVQKPILKDKTNIFIFNINNTINSTNYFPLYNNISNFLKNSLSLNNKLSNNYLLSLYILYQLKGNFTESLKIIKKNFTNEKNIFLNFLKFRINNPFIINYLHNLPLSSNLNLLSFSNDNILDYKISGSSKLNINFIKTIYQGLIEHFSKNYLIGHWLSNENSNLFYSIYNFVNSRGIEINEIKYLIPFIELCRHSNNFNKMKINLNNNIFNIKSYENYNEHDEFFYKYSDDLSNDNFLLNYGFIIKNNSFHNFLFKFEINDDKYLFYKYLIKEKFNMDYVNLMNNDIITVIFPLNNYSLNKELLQFLFLFSQFENNKIKSHNKNFKIKKDINKENKENKLFDLYYLYFNTIHQNIFNFYDLLPMYNNTSPKIINYINELNKTREEINKMDSEIEKLDNGTIIDNFENLYYFNKLHELLNMKNIHIFNLENLMILFNHKNFVYKEILSYKWKILNNSKIKNKYF